MTGRLQVVDMVAQGLKAGGYEGLFSEDGECACGLEDLAPCGNIQAHCTAGFKVMDGEGEFDFRIQLQKPEKP